MNGRWIRIVLWIACGAVLIADVGVLAVRRLDTATPLTVDTALRRYQKTGSATTGSGSPLPMPPPGVYVYATIGAEEINVLGGVRHDYPDRTTITISPVGCGRQVRWDVLEERWDQQVACVTAEGETLDSTTQYHRFFNQEDVRTFDCEGLARPKGDTPGTTWKSRCTHGTSAVDVVLRIVNFETMVVDGVEVETVHVSARATVSGDNRGTSTQEVWARRDDGLIVRRIGTVDSDSESPIGPVNYQERYEIVLTSLEPRR